MSSDTPLQRELEVQNAKAMLLQSKDGEQSTYDILAKAIRVILDERPANPADVIAPIIQRVQRETCIADSNLSALQTSNESSTEVQVAEKQRALFEVGGSGENEVPEEEDESQMTILPDMQELLYYFEQGGVGLGREEWTRVYFALKKLTETVSVVSCRFWGKILGLEKNYYVAEIQFRDEEEYEEESNENSESNNENGSENAEDDDDNSDKLPTSSYKPSPTIPSEVAGRAGVNKYVYFVCNEPGDEWVRLPSCTPQHVQNSRQITKFLTGRLDASVTCFPNWVGNESHLLRAQIARISAGTIIAPMTYYQFDDEEEVEDEDMGNTEYIENPDFEGVSIRDLADPSMQSWVHSRLHILQQGRCIWINPSNKEEGDVEEDEDEDEGDEDNHEAEQEIGPPLLTALSDDVEVGGLPPWSCHLSSGLSLIQHAICIVKSNLWPGAVAFSNGRKFENIYIGYGIKYQNDNFSPPQPQAFQPEYNTPVLEEDHDPTVEEETALKQQAEADEGEDEAEEDEIDD